MSRPATPQRSSCTTSSQTTFASCAFVAEEDEAEEEEDEEAAPLVLLGQGDACPTSHSVPSRKGLSGTRKSVSRKMTGRFGSRAPWSHTMAVVGAPPGGDIEADEDEDEDDEELLLTAKGNAGFAAMPAGKCGMARRAVCTAALPQRMAPP